MNNVYITLLITLELPADKDDKAIINVVFFHQFVRFPGTDTQSQNIHLHKRKSNLFIQLKHLLLSVP